MHSQSFRIFLFGLTTLLFACNDGGSVNDNDVLQHRLVHLESRALDNMVFIEGGTFTMGDFGAVGEDGIWRPFFPPTAERNKAHSVTLTSYSFGSHKTTWEDFDTYLIANELDVIARIFNEEWPREPFDSDQASRY